jgi:hypothetical protein
LPLDAHGAWRWYARQLAALARHGDEALRAELRDAWRYGSALRTTAVADALFAPLAEAVSEVVAEEVAEAAPGGGEADALQRWLVSVSGAVSWSVKGALCERLAAAWLGAAPAPELGSEAWAEELLLLGVDEEEVDALYHDVYAGRAAGEVWNHDVFGEPEPAYGRDGGQLAALCARRERFDKFLPGDDSPVRLVLQTAVVLLAFWRAPLHASLDFVRVCAWAPHADAPGRHAALVRRWLARQISACLQLAWRDEDGPAPWAEHVVDQFFGFTSVDPVLFPWLVEDVPAAQHPALLAASATVAWAGKRAFYARLAADPAEHALLGEALARSCRSDVFHSIDAREALALLEQLDGLEPERRRQLRALLTEPARAAVLAAAEPEDPAFCAQHPGRVFVALAFAGELPMWLMDAELW